MASSKPSPSSFPNLLLSVLNLVLFTLAATPAGHTVLLRRFCPRRPHTPPPGGAPRAPLSSADKAASRYTCALLQRIRHAGSARLAVWEARQLARLECSVLQAMVLALSCRERGFYDVAAVLRWSRRGAWAAEIEEKLKNKYGHNASHVQCVKS